MRPILYREPLFWVLTSLTIIASCLGLGLTYFSSDLNNLFHEQQQSQDLNNTLNDLLFNLTNAETGQRGYLITQNPAYLAPYNQALPQINKDLATLKASPLVNNDKSWVDKVTKTATNKITEMNQTISTLQSEGQAASFAIVDSNTGINDMNALRTLIGKFSNDQKKQLASRIDQDEKRTKILKYIAPVTALVDIILIAFVATLTRRAINKEQQLDNLKEQFVALASHQLRTPATAVKQYINLLLSGTFGKLKKEQQDILNVINSSNERGIQVANSLINVSRADNREITISEKPINLSELLKHVLGHYTEALKESRGQRIKLDMPKRSVVAKVDQFYIRMIFENLIENASKYSEDKKKILVTLKSKGDIVTFSVADEGKGIDEQDLPLLFKKFSRLDHGMKQTEGSGLGLYLVKQAAELHGGDVEVISTPGKGSTFTATFRKDL